MLLVEAIETLDDLAVLYDHVKQQSNIELASITLGSDAIDKDAAPIIGEHVEGLQRESTARELHQPPEEAEYFRLSSIVLG